MSITHSLMIATEKTEAELRQFLLNGFGLTQDVENHLRSKGVRVSVKESKGLRKEVILEDYGVSANRAINFRLKFAESEYEGEHIVARVTAALLRHETGDMVLLLCDDTPVVQRINGHIIFDDQWEVKWLIPALDEAGIKYDQHQLTSQAIQ